MWYLCNKIKSASACFRDFSLDFPPLPDPARKGSSRCIFTFQHRSSSITKTLTPASPRPQHGNGRLAVPAWICRGSRSSSQRGRCGVTGNWPVDMAYCPQLGLLPLPPPPSVYGPDRGGEEAGNLLLCSRRPGSQATRGETEGRRNIKGTLSIGCVCVCVWYEWG